MRRRRVREGERPPYSQIGAGAVWAGKVSGGGMVIVLGEARAAVAVDGEVIAGPSGRLVSPSGSCRSLRVEGSVEGDWRVIEAAEVGPGGCLAGSLDTRSLLFSSKAIIKGRLGVSVRSSNTD